jgi:hypothetical protein
MKELLEDKYRITSFKKFVEIIEERHSPNPANPLKWIFRGQDNYSYKLIPSVGRLLGTERYPTEEAVLKAEKNSFHSFEIQTYHELKEHNLFLLLAVAQHHGLKTRLLDWTFSPFVALFFAVENQEKHNVDGALFGFYRMKSLTNVLRAKKHPFADLGVSQYQYLSIPSLTPRITAQSGLFQLFKNPTLPFEKDDQLEKFIIPASVKQELKNDLSNFGISYNTLFPGMDGLAKYLNFVYLNENPY